MHIPQAMALVAEELFREAHFTETALRQDRSGAARAQLAHCVFSAAARRPEVIQPVTLALQSSSSQLAILPLCTTDVSAMCPKYNTCIYAMRADLLIFAAQTLSMRL